MIRTIHLFIRKPLTRLACAGLIFASSSAVAEELSLREQLVDQASKSQMPPEVKAKMAKHLQGLTDSDLIDGALKTGDKAPNFTLKDHLGNERSLSEFLKDGSVILSWYRGGW